MENQPKQFAQIALVTLLILGCAFVLRAFVGGILFAAIICVTSWPLYRKLLARLGERDALAATLMTLALLLLVIGPLLLFGASIAEGVRLLVDVVRPVFEEGLPAHPPEWLRTLPFIGAQIDAYWVDLARSRDEFSRLLRQFAEPARNVALQTGSMIGQGALQLLLVVFVAFFFYRDGRALAKALRTGARQLGGDLGLHLLSLSQTTVTGVMIGIVGTAAGQAAVALAGFLIAGVPGAMLLAAGTFFLSMIPVGPPLLWGGAAWWLYDSGQPGWAIFMVVWGVFAISSIDNFLKPFLISRSASLPLLLIALGVFGGVLAFGFIGIFLGPTLLALGHMLALHWTGEEGKLLRHD